MSTPSKRKFERQKKRQQKLAQKNLTAENEAAVERRRRQYMETFPEFVFLPGNAPLGFVDAIRQAVAKIDFENRQQFGPRERGFFANLKLNPFLAQEFLSSLKDNDFKGHLHLMTIIGNLVFTIEQERISEWVNNKWIPFNDVRFWLDFQKGRILVKFSSLLMQKSPDGRIFYCSEHRPQLEVEGQMKIVSWREHAVKRVCERLAYDWKSYGGLGDAFAFLNRCTHFERCLLYPNQLGFTFFNNCIKGFSSERIAKFVVGDEAKNGDWFYRLGYCAADLEGDFLIARTVLPPGYGSTPEFGLILKSGLPRESKDKMIQDLNYMIFEKQVSHDDLAFIKWFHDNGIPQVVRGSSDWFAKM